jgi:uncharacterized RDD family membrane protein YckC
MKQVGIGTRVLNFIVDSLVVLFISYIISKINDYYAQQFRMQNQNFKYQFNFGYLYWVVLFFYYTLCEFIFCRTVGKLFSFSKVVTNHNKRPNILQILIRSAVRLTIIDMFFIPFLDKTLHDYLSKTAVVEV